jgi:hypothetical protein
MATIQDNRNSLDKTIRIFDTFYNIDLVIDANQFDVVFGYFYETSGSKKIAGNFTSILFRISQMTGINVLTLLADLQGQPNTVSVNKTIAYYLNSLKSKTALYGISNVPIPNFPVARNVVL